MKTIKKFKNFIDEIMESNSRNYKISILEKYKTDSEISEFLWFVFDPFAITGISTKKLAKDLLTDSKFNEDFIEVPKSSKALLHYLVQHNTGRDYDVYVVQKYLQQLPSELTEFFKKVITKDISIGVDAKSINKVIPGLISTFNVQLANKYFEDPNRVIGKKFAITRKIDGCRIIAYRDHSGVKFFTRQGQPYEGLVDLETEMLDYIPENTCLDGEITLLNPAGLVSKDQYKATTKIVRADGEKHGVKMLVFDIMTTIEFKAQCCSTPYAKRREFLTRLFNRHDFKYFNLLPVLYEGDDASQITRLLDELTLKGEEGIMINILDAPYDFKRTWNLIKVKKFDSCDLRVIGFEEGTGKNIGRLGAILCEYKNGNIVKCGSGFDDMMRIEVWNNQAKYLNTIAEIGYFEETSNANGGISLRFPTFKDWRFDKSEPNY